MGCALDDIDNTLVAACSTLLKTATPAGPVSIVDRWVGDLPVTAESLKEAGYRTPFLLVAFEGEQFYDKNSITTLASQYQFAAKSLWTVIIGTSDPRQAKRAAKGDVTSVGAYKLASLVIGACNDLYVPSPNTVLNLQLVGTPGARVTLDGVTHTAVSLGTNTQYQYTPAAQTVTLDGSGHATVLAPLTGPPGTLGAISPATPLTWSTIPAGLSATAYNLGFNVQGANGLLWEKVVTYENTRPLPKGMIPGVLFTLGVRFSAVRRAEQATPEDPSTTFTKLDANVNEIEPTSTAPNPLAVFEVKPNG